MLSSLFPGLVCVVDNLMEVWELAVSHLDINLLVGGTVALCPSRAMRNYLLQFLNNV